MADAHLLHDDDQRVLVLGQEVENAPDLEGVVVGDDQLALVQVLPGAERPAHLVEVLTVEVVGHLQQNQHQLQWQVGFCRDPVRDSIASGACLCLKMWLRGRIQPGKLWNSRVQCGGCS